MISVRILVSIPEPKRFDACTLCFDTLRVGWPTAHIQVFINNPGSLSEEGYRLLRHKIHCVGAQQITIETKVHHAEWIRAQVQHATDGPLVILDADTLFWKSCEDWEFFDDTLLAGYYVPRMWNDFAKCISFPRIHTSLMWFPNPAALRQRIATSYPYALKQTGDYCPCDPFMPAVRFINGQPYFWDSCANLYNMLPNSALYTFEPQHLECFDHLNSASFYDVMHERLDDASGFDYAHNVLVKTPDKLRNSWPIVNTYYRRKEIEAQVRIPECVA